MKRFSLVFIRSWRNHRMAGWKGPEGSFCLSWQKKLNLFFISNVNFEALLLKIPVWIFFFTLWCEFAYPGFIINMKRDLISSVMWACSSLDQCCGRKPASVDWFLQPCEVWSQFRIIHSHRQQQKLALWQARWASGGCRVSALLLQQLFPTLYPCHTYSGGNLSPTLFAS